MRIGIGPGNDQCCTNQEIGKDAIQVYSKIKTLQTDDDKLSLLAVQAAVRSSRGTFHYLEIGTYLGGSLQPLLIDDACQTIYAIDAWPKIERDERGNYPTDQSISCPAMLQEVERFYAPCLHKLICLIGTSGTLDPAQVTSKPSFCFIDGEHTNEACLRDFKFCLQVAAPESVIVFHDADIIFRGLAECHRHLEDQRIPFVAYNLPSSVAVIEVGGIDIFCNPVLLSRLLRSQKAFIHCMENLAAYRDKLVRLKRLPFYSQLAAIYRIMQRMHLLE